MSFRILNQAPVYLLANGQPAAGGSLETYETDLSTPKVTFSDPELTVPNPTSITLDSAGRTETDVWSDGELGLVLKNSLGVIQWTRNNVRAGDEAEATIPTPTGGDADTFLYWDGSAYSWVPVLQVPDPTGLANFQLVSDGTSVPVWQQIPETPDPPDPEVVVDTDLFRAGTSDDPTKFFLQMGDGSAPATGIVNTSLAVVFDTEFSTAPRVFVQPTSDSNAGGPMVAELTAISTTGFTVLFTIAAGNLSSAVILNSVPFNWLAIGTLEVP